jgi:YfiR/HmsC-like
VVVDTVNCASHPFSRNVIHRWRKALRAVTVLVSSIVAISSSAPAASGTTNASEREVKAAILYRVAKFIEWPTSAFSSTDAAFVVCVLGDDKTLRAFSSLIGKLVNSHPIEVRRVQGDTLDLRLCHTAYFPADGNVDIDYALTQLKGMPVLTVGEAEEFANRGGILALLMREQRISFSFNLPASKQAGLSVSAQLLQLANIVGRAP